MKTHIRKYYICTTCNLTFKDIIGATEHKTNSLHTLTTEYFPIRRPFPPFRVEKKIDLPTLDSSLRSFPIGEPAYPVADKGRYVCLSCGLRFKTLHDAEEHRQNSRHKIVKENYQIPSESSYKTIEDIIGSNIDYDTLEQRMHRWTGN